MTRFVRWSLITLVLFGLLGCPEPDPWDDTWGNVLDTTAPDVFGDVSFSTSSLSVGTHYIGLTVTDEGGLQAQDIIEVTVY